MKFTASENRLLELELKESEALQFIVGPPLIGKSQLLEQLAQKHSPGASVLSWREFTELSEENCPPEIYIDLHQEIPSDIDLIFRKKCRSKIYIAARSLPDLPIEWIHSVHIYRFESWTNDEISSLIPRELEAHQNQILKDCLGHPSIALKMIYELERGIDPAAAKLAYFHYLIQQLQPKSLQNLLVYSKLKFFREKASQLLQEINSEELIWIKKYGILILKPHLHLSELGYHLISKISQNENSSNLIESCIAYLNLHLDSIDAVKDLVRLHLEIGNDGHALSHFIQCSKEAYLSAEFSDFVELSNQFYHLLPVDLFLLRRESLAYLGKNEQALYETDERLKSADSSDKTSLYYCLALCHFAGGKTEQALQLIEEILSHPSGEEIYIRTLIAKSFFITPLDAAEALRLCDQAVQLSQKLDDNQSLQGEASFQKGLVFDFHHQKAEALFYYKDAHQTFSLVRNRSKKLLCALNIANLEFDVGNTKHFFSLLDSIEKESQKLKLIYLQKACSLARSIFFAAQGKFVEAKRCIRKSLQHQTEESPQRLDYLLQRTLCLILFEEKRYADARSLLAQLATSKLKKNQIQDYLVIQSLAKIADLALLKDFHLIPKLSKEIYASNLTPSNKMGALIYILDVNYRFYMPNSCKDLVGKIETLISYGHEIDRITHLKILCGIYRFFNSDFKKAIHHLSEAELSSKEASFDLLHFRSLIFLAACYIRQRKIPIAKAKIEAARTYLLRMGSEFEENLLNFFEGACYFLEPELDTFNHYLHNMKNCYAKTRLLELIENSTTEKVADEGFRPQFYDQLQNLLQLTRKNYYAIKTAESMHLVPVQNINALPIQNSDIVINEVTRKIFIGKRTLSYSKKSLLIRLFRYLLQNAGQYISKEELCTKVWIENYNTIVHDQRIYTAVRRLRRLLRKPNLIVEQEGKYSVPTHWRYAVISDNEEINLNDRQTWILNFIENHGSTSRSALSKALQLSDSSCKADLNKLIMAQKIEAFGNGKNTRYRRT